MSEGGDNTRGRLGIWGGLRGVLILDFTLVPDEVPFVNVESTKMRNLHVSDALGYSRNWNMYRIPKDRDEVNRREVGECDG